MYQCTVKVRRNSWQPKPRHGDPESDVKYRQWWHDSSKSEWWALFEDPNTSREHTFAGRAFHSEFHMPRAVFDQSLACLRVKFPDKVHGDGKAGSRTQPLILKWAACVVVLTEKLSFYRAAKIARLNPDRLRKFFHAAMQYLAEDVAPLHIYTPRDEDELADTENLFRRSGFPGAFMSMDVVHVPWPQCPEGYKVTCTGKEGFPTLCWNVGVDRRKIITHIFGPNHGARNDKTIARFDPLIQDMHNNSNALIANYVFQIKQYGVSISI